MKPKPLLLLLLLPAAVLLTACSRTDEYASYAFYAMDTYVSVSADGASASDLAAAADCVTALEDRLSRTKESSDLSLLNSAPSAAVSDETFALLSRAVTLCEQTHGAFDTGIGRIVGLWDITGKRYLPTPEEIGALLPSSTCNGTVFSGGNLVTKPFFDTVYDLGACAKGYAAEKAVALLKNRGIRNAMISLGGNIAVTGHPKGFDTWRIGIKNPYFPDTIIGYVPCTDTVVSVSGAYERFFIRDGVRYHHIFDPATGYPAQSDIESVAVFSEDGFLADALSTALFVMGYEKANALYREGTFAFDAVFVLTDGTVCVTDGLDGVFVFDQTARFSDGTALVYR